MVDSESLWVCALMHEIEMLAWRRTPRERKRPVNLHKTVVAMPVNSERSLLTGSADVPKLLSIGPGADVMPVMEFGPDVLVELVDGSLCIVESSALEEPGLCRRICNRRAKPPHAVDELEMAELAAASSSL